MMIIRPMQYRDLQEAARLMNETEMHHRQLGSDFLEEDVPARMNGIIETMLTCMAAPDKSLMMVAESDDGIVGFLGALLHYSYPYAQHKLSVYIMNLSIKDDINKISKAVMIRTAYKALIQWARNNGATQVFGYTYHADSRARDLFRRFNLKADYIRYGAIIDQKEH
jgi:arginine/ornithine N-succinyltransferase beta subunit